MKVIQLTTDQQTQIKALQSAVTATQLPYVTARKALNDYVDTLAPSAKVHNRRRGLNQVVLSDDGTSLIITS